MPPFYLVRPVQEGGRIPFRPVLTPGRTAKDRTSTHQRKDYDMNDEKKIGFSVELENNRVDLWGRPPRGGRG